MSEADVLSAKEIVSDGILSKLGVNDTASCYALDGKFKDSSSIVFGFSNDQPPGLPNETAQKILDLVKAKKSLQPAVCDKATVRLIEQVKAQEAKADSKRESWQNKIQSLQRPDIDGSNYVKALEGITRSIANHKTQSGRDTWLVIVGDLKNESPANQPVHADAAMRTFNHIVLIYPFNSSDPKWEVTEKFWQDYFGDIPYEKHTFAEVRRDNSLIAPNPASGFETYEGEGYWRVFLPYLVPVVVVASVVIFLAWFFPFRRTDQHAPARE
jgi:hypothetical protein